MATYVPNASQLEKARARDSFILVIYGNYNNAIFEAWERYATKKSIQFTNVQGVGHNEQMGMFRDMVYWIKFKAPAPDNVLQYAYNNPDVKMRIFL